MATTRIRLRRRSLAIGAAVLCLVVACGAPSTPNAPAAKSAPAAPPAPAAQSAPAAPQAAAPAAPAASAGKQMVDDLIKRANEEGEVAVTVLSSWSQDLHAPLVEAFKKRFGLTINVQVTNIAAAQHYPVAIAETRAGTPPTYDTVQGDLTETVQLMGAGGFVPIENWQAILAEINPMVKEGKVTPDQVSQPLVAGRGFMINGNVKQIIYNPRLISEAELPRTHADLANPRYKDKFAQPPWTSHWAIGPAALENVNRDQWLDTVRAAGRNGGAVLAESPAVARVALGQYAFALGQDTLVRQTLAKDPQAPIAARFMDDYNEYNSTYYAVRTGTRHPAAATLWVFWIISPEAEAIWQPSEFFAVKYGDSPIDQEQTRMIREAGSKVVSWLDNPRTLELMEWYQTADGRQYLDAMSKAIRGE